MLPSLFTKRMCASISQQETTVLVASRAQLEQRIAVLRSELKPRGGDASLHPHPRIRHGIFRQTMTQLNAAIGALAGVSPVSAAHTHELHEVLDAFCMFSLNPGEVLNWSDPLSSLFPLLSACRLLKLELLRLGGKLQTCTLQHIGRAAWSRLWRRAKRPRWTKRRR